MLDTVVLLDGPRAAVEVQQAQAGIRKHSLATSNLTIRYETKERVDQGTMAHGNYTLPSIRSRNGPTG